MKKGLLLTGILAGFIFAGGSASAEKVQFDPTTPPTIFSLGLRSSPFDRSVSVRELTPAQRISPESYRELDTQIYILGELIRRDNRR